MNEAQKRIRGPRKTVDFDSEIAAAEARLRMLIDAKKEKEQRDLEANRQAIAALLKAQGLDRIGVDQWRDMAPRLGELLGGKLEKKPKRAVVEQSQSEPEAI